MTRRIGILTAGSDCPGLNAAIRAIGKAAQGEYGMEVIAFQEGFQGLINDQTMTPPLSGILTLGGTILGTNRDQPRRALAQGQTVDKTGAVIETYKRHGLDALVCIGGVETIESAYHLSQQGLNLIAIPKGILNDVGLTDRTIGFDTAMGTATEAIDRLHSTAQSNQRIILVEIQGRSAGWLTLGAGIAGGADVIIIPEIPYDLKKIADAILERSRSGKRFSIVAVSEGGISKDTVEFFDRSKSVNHKLRSGQDAVQVDQTLDEIEGKLTGNTVYLADRLESYTGIEARITILGHLLRGGAPSAADRLLATSLGTTCASLIKEGTTGVMVAMQEGKAVPVPLADVAGKHKPVPLDHPWIQSARCVGTNLGD